MRKQERLSGDQSPAGTAGSSFPLGVGCLRDGPGRKADLASSGASAAGGGGAHGALGLLGTRGRADIGEGTPTVTGDPLAEQVR